MKKIIAYPLIVICVALLIINGLDSAVSFGGIYGFWIGLIGIFSIPITLLLRSILLIYFNGDWSELIINLVLIGLIMLSNHMLKVKYIIKKPKELRINEENLPQISKYDSIKAILSIPLVYYGVMFGAALTLIISVVLIFLIYYGEASATGKYHPGILLAIGLGAIYGIFGSLYSIVKSFTRKPDYVIGFLVKDKESPIYKLAREVANRVNSSVPEHILVVYSPDFHVQEANSKLVSGEHIKGNTLTIGFPFLKYLSTSELKAVIGHEMAHFTGRDTVFSTKIAPAYRSLRLWISSLNDIASDEKGSAWAKLPNLIPLLMANKVFNWYVKNLSRIDRVREARADMIGSICYGTNVFSNALKKVKQVGYLFNEASNRDQFEYASNGKSIDNYFEYFDENYMHDNKVKEYLDDIVKKDKITSEFDSHYSFEERISYLPDDNVVDYSTTERLLDSKTMASYSEKLSKMYSDHINNIFQIIRSAQEQAVTDESQASETNLDNEQHSGELLTFPKCPKCGREFSDSTVVCRYCGVRLMRYSGDLATDSEKKPAQQNSFCSKCGKAIEPTMSFCKNCGSKIK